jgi:ribosomal protein L11 methyltransferase
VSKTIDQRYVEYDFTVTPTEPWNDVLIAQLGELGFESFIHTDTGVKAYLPIVSNDDPDIQSLDILSYDLVDIAFAKAEVPPTNWNAEWEKNFDPIYVDDLCEVRAPFHESKGLKHEIVIEPKMSFGTGHHETTHMMIQHLLKEDLSGLTVLDMGSGTGVLAILAAQRGATEVDAIDIDTWCYENALENVERNNVNQIKVILGGAEQLGEKMYDVIIANINRNILLNDMEVYNRQLKDKGKLFLSGFYTEDEEIIKDKCAQLGVIFDSKLQLNNWVALKMIKQA